jgi:hypothetical protein
MLAAASLICGRCGNLRSVCSDASIDWHPQESVCYPTGTREWGVRRVQAKHKNFKPDATDERGELLMSPLDGLTVWVSDIDIESMARSGNDVADASKGEPDEPNAGQSGG